LYKFAIRTLLHRYKKTYSTRVHIHSTRQFA